MEASAAGVANEPRPVHRRSALATIAYPTAFPLSIIVFIWGTSEINLLEIVRPVVVAVVVTVGLTLSLGVLARDRRLGAIATSALMIGLITDRTEGRILLTIVAAAVIAIGHVPQGTILRVTRTATRILEVIATVVLLAAVISAAGRPGFLYVVQEPFLSPPGPADRPLPPPGSPDIFVYLLDGYPGATAATRLPGLDAAVFPAALADRGFTVHGDSRTNYLITRIVLASMFDGRHIAEIPDLAPPHGPDQSADARRLRAVQERSAGLAAIRAAGYDLVWVSSGWSHLDIRTVDRRIEAPGISEFELVVIRQTAVGKILQAVDPHGLADTIRTRIRAAFQAATAIAAEPHGRPRFVFVHVPAPHPPLVYTASGADAVPGPDSRWDLPDPEGTASGERAAREAAHVQAIGRMTIDAIDAMRTAATTPPVVVIFSDHGSDVGWNDDAPLTADLEERSSSFLATLTPGHPELFRERTTPVNIIGTLSNAYLGTNVPRQPDVTYAFDGSVLNPVRVQTGTGD
jgi:hypothetical protein